MKQAMLFVVVFLCTLVLSHAGWTNVHNTEDFLNSEPISISGTIKKAAPKKAVVPENPQLKRMKRQISAMKRLREQREKQTMLMMERKIEYIRLKRIHQEEKMLKEKFDRIASQIQ